MQQALWLRSLPITVTKVVQNYSHVSCWDRWVPVAPLRHLVSTEGSSQRTPCDALASSAWTTSKSSQARTDVIKKKPTQTSHCKCTRTGQEHKEGTDECELLTQCFSSLSKYTRNHSRAIPFSRSVDCNRPLRCLISLAIRETKYSNTSEIQITREPPRSPSICTRARTLIRVLEEDAWTPHNIDSSLKEGPEFSLEMVVFPHQLHKTGVSLLEHRRINSSGAFLGDFDS